MKGFWDTARQYSARPPAERITEERNRQEQPDRHLIKLGDKKANQGTKNDVAPKEKTQIRRLTIHN
jgi:hypothetical protein